MPLSRRNRALRARDARRQALAEARDIAEIVRVARRLLPTAPQLFQPDEVLDDTRAVFRRLALLVRTTMTVAYLGGLRRSRIRFAHLRPLKAKRRGVSENFDDMVKGWQELMDLPDRQLALIQQRLGTKVLQVVDRAEATVRRRLQSVITDNVAKGLHVRDAKKALGEAFDKAGITPRNSFTLEAIVRTQTQLAYASGKATYEQSDEVQEILWGYQYLTVGDDRVRPEHEAIDGVTLPKDDPFWSRNYPPNGWACRCSALPLTTPERVKRGPDKIELPSGREVRTGAAPGFAFNPAELVGDVRV